MDYIIEQVLEVSDAKFGKRVKFKLEGVDGTVTTFTKFPDSMVAGAKITGSITESQYGKDFKFGSKATSPQSGTPITSMPPELKNYLDLKIIPMLQHIEAHLDRIEKFVTGDAALDEAFKTATTKDNQPDDLGIPF